MKLYEGVRSSASFRVRIALNLKGLPYDSQVIDLRAGEHRRPEYARINPQQAVPALADGGRTLVQSMAILEYLDEIHPEPPLLPRTAAERARVRAMAQLVACEIHPLNNTRVLGYLEQELRVSEQARDRWYAHWVHEGFRGLEPMLGDAETGQFCHGDAPTFADVFLVPQVVNAQRFKVDLAEFPRVVRIFDRCMKLPAFERAHPKNHPAGG
ncbi:MAG TPA: maleylacetoacetate isomerase [Myxococcales bacterium]|jgi:maleylacetoacetate isomerase/maleylpyruvate isomerase|nr:maleylacetoacetate isomerase [Myxococcales bacterium]